MNMNFVQTNAAMVISIDTLKEFKTPGSEKKIRRKLKKASKSITPLILKSKGEIANISEKKSQ